MYDKKTPRLIRPQQQAQLYDAPIDDTTDTVVH